MARERLFRAGALNLKRINGAKPNVYVDLLRAAVKTRAHASFHGKRRGMISWLSREEEEGLVSGQFALFTDFDPSAPWLNIKSAKEVDADEAEQAIKIPDELRPDYSLVDFVFHPKRHRLVFDLSGLSVNSARRLMEGLLNSRAVRSGAEAIEVTVEQDRQSLDRILALKELEMIEIFYTRPNPDDLDSVEEELKERLKRQGARSVSEEYVAAEGASLRLDEESMIKAQLALSQGYVSGKGVAEDGRKKTLTTQKAPLVWRTVFDPDKLSVPKLLRYAANEIIDEITSKLRR